MSGVYTFPFLGLGCLGLGLVMPSVWRDPINLGRCAVCGRRWYGCDEDSSSFGAAFFVIHGGFPVSAISGGLRYVTPRVGFPRPVRRGLFFLGGVSGGRRRGCARSSFDIRASFPDFAGGGGISEVPSLFFFFGDTGEDLGRYSYRHLEKSGRFSSSTASGGFFSLPGLSSSSEPGLLVIETPDPLFTGEMMAFGHLDWPVRSVIKRHVGLPDVMLMVPLKLSAVLRRYGGRLHGRQLRSSATRQTGSILQGRGCILYFFQSCLCKFGNVSYQKFK